MVCDPTVRHGYWGSGSCLQSWRDRGRFLELGSELRSQDGSLLAQADGLFARVAGRQAEELRELYEAAVSEPATGRQTETMTSLQDGRP